MSVPARLDPRAAHLLVVATWAILALLRALGPSDLLDNDQERPAAYVLSILQDQRWLCPRDGNGQVATKPPLVPWCSAVLSMLATRPISHGVLGLTSALAVLLVAMAIFGFGSRSFGTEAATLAALAWLLSGPGVKQLGLIRTDPAFAAATFLLALALWRAVHVGSGRVRVVVLGTMTVFIKGPLGLLLAALGLLALPWEARCHRAASLRPKLLLAGLSPLLLVGLWFLAARWFEGPEVTARLLGRELVGHAVSDSKGRFPGHGLPRPTLYLLQRFAPWSLVTFAGLWGVLLARARSARERRATRFLTAYLLGGLVIFSFAPHQRADHLLPLLPAAALLAGDTLSRWRARRWSTLEPRAAVGVIWCLGLMGSVAYLWFGFGRPHIDDEHLLRPFVQSAARAAPQSGVFVVSGPEALEIWLGRLQPRVPLAEANALLRRESPPWLLMTRSDAATLSAASLTEPPGGGGRDSRRDLLLVRALGSPTSLGGPDVERWRQGFVIVGVVLVSALMAAAPAWTATHRFRVR